jgi:hypothetical protein
VNWMSPIFLCLLGVSQIAGAQNIYKCVGPDGLAYRDTPCPPDQREQTVISAPHQANWQAESLPTTDFPSVRAGLPLSGTRLTLGMTDTQVLNLPSWGRPAQIFRTRAKSGWREEWLYKRASDTPCVLYFENGRLAAQEDAPPPPTMEARASTAYIQQ